MKEVKEIFVSAVNQVIHMKVLSNDMAEQDLILSREIAILLIEQLYVSLHMPGVRLRDIDA